MDDSGNLMAEELSPIAKSTLVSSADASVDIERFYEHDVVKPFGPTSIAKEYQSRRHSLRNQSCDSAQ